MLAEINMIISLKRKALYLFSLRFDWEKVLDSRDLKPAAELSSLN